MKKKILDIGFLLLEAVMHVYLTVYLISIHASLLAIGFTIFELSMFIRLLKHGVKPQNATCDDICPWKKSVKPAEVENCEHEYVITSFKESRVTCVGCNKKFCPHSWDDYSCCCTLEFIVERREEKNE